MDTVNPTDSLNASIAMLEQKRATDFRSLKEQLHTTGESLKPANLIRGAVRDVVGSPQLKSILIKTAIGLAAGFIAKKLVTRQQTSTKKQILGNALQYGITLLASNQNTMIRTAGVLVAKSILNGIKNRRAKRHHSNGHSPA